MDRESIRVSFVEIFRPQKCNSYKSPWSIGDPCAITIYLYIYVTYERDSDIQFEKCNVT